MSALLFNTFLLIIIHLLSIFQVNGLTSVDNYKCHYNSYDARNTTLTSDELMTLTHSINFETSNITHFLGYTTIYSIQLFEIVSPISYDSIILPKAAELVLSFINNITFVQCINTCKTLLVSCRSLFYLRDKSECQLYRDQASYLPDDIKRYFASTETVPPKFIKETEGRPAYYAQKKCFSLRRGVWCGKNSDDYIPFGSKWLDQAREKICRDIGTQRCMNDKRNKLDKFNCMLFSRLLDCNNSVHGKYRYPYVSLDTSFESICDSKSSKRKYDDWPALSFATKGKKGINSNWYNNDYRNGLELKRKEEEKRILKEFKSRQRNLTENNIVGSFTYALVPLFVWICVIIKAKYCASSRPAESQLDTHQMRQESTPTEQVFPAEGHPIASQLRVILPDDDFIRVSTTVTKNQNGEDLPPSYEECCPILTMSSYKMGEQEAEEEGPPTYVDFLKDFLNKGMAEHKIKIHIRSANVNNRLETDV